MTNYVADLHSASHVLNIGIADTTIHEVDDWFLYQDDLYFTAWQPLFF